MDKQKYLEIALTNNNSNINGNQSLTLGNIFFLL
jgi:hypothetical protein